MALDDSFDKVVEDSVVLIVSYEVCLQDSCRGSRNSVLMEPFRGLSSQCMSLVALVATLPLRPSDVSSPPNDRKREKTSFSTPLLVAEAVYCRHLKE